MVLDTPWGLWKFLGPLPRVELSLHSIHYLDMVRALLGEPLGIHAKTIGHPDSKIAQTRMAAIPALVDVNKLGARYSDVVGTTGSGTSTTIVSLMNTLLGVFFAVNEM
ncbi:hypothetical protein [uncultured Roseobacter sp.]|uniref:hypothetical protein n=1 Tax=uncultured Roseobacter sp. TaxID=114847 RepID=UPI0026058F08|nr:hypothetical protein [uncultured Roseobacter sp.]